MSDKPHFDLKREGTFFYALDDDRTAWLPDGKNYWSFKVDANNQYPESLAIEVADELERRWNAHDALVEALEAIRTAIENNAAPFTPEYALAQVDMVSLSSELVGDALTALALARGDSQ